MKPEHEHATRIALSSLRDKGFALAGGNALSKHGIGNRESDDIDLFTSDINQNVGDSVQDLLSAFEEQGYTARRRPTSTLVWTTAARRPWRPTSAR
jgi:hypothetical protein